MNRKAIAAAAMTAALATGGILGATFGTPSVSGAQDGGTTTTTAPSTTDAPDGGGPGMGHRGGGVELAAAAKALGLTEDEVRTQLQAGKTLAEIAEAQGVDRQDLVDALVAAGEERLDEAKAALPDRIDELVDRKLPGDADGGGRPGGRGIRELALDTAATTLGLSEDDLRTQLRDGKTLADIASAQGVSVDDLVAALVKAAQERIDQAVTDGKLTQERADELSKHLTERITARVNGERPERPAGGHRGDDADTTTTTTTD